MLSTASKMYIHNSKPKTKKKARDANIKVVSSHSAQYNCHALPFKPNSNVRYVGHEKMSIQFQIHTTKCLVTSFQKRKDPNASIARRRSEDAYDTIDERNMLGAPAHARQPAPTREKPTADSMYETMTQRTTSPVPQTVVVAAEDIHVTTDRDVTERCVLPAAGKSDSDDMTSNEGYMQPSVSDSRDDYVCMDGLTSAAGKQL